MKQGRILGLLMLGAITFNSGATLNAFADSKIERNDIHTKLYEYMTSSKNQAKIDKEAIRLHGGIKSNNCIFFVSSALREVGVDIPMSTGYTVSLENQLRQKGWKKHVDLNNLQKGDVAFCGKAHVYIFMGWADKKQMMAYIVDNQKCRYGNTYHIRNVKYGMATPTSHFYRYGCDNYKVVKTSTKKELNTLNKQNIFYTGMVSVNTYLNVRKDSSIHAPIIGSLKKNEIVNVLEENNSWCKINYNGQVGYVYKSYIKRNYKNEKDSPSNYKVGQVVNVATNLRVRKSNSLKSYVIGYLGNNEKVSILEKSGKWYKINFRGQIGWVFSDYIKEI